MELKWTDLVYILDNCGYEIAEIREIAEAVKTLGGAEIIIHFNKDGNVTDSEVLY